MKEDPDEEDPAEVTRYRALAATANYLSQDRMDMQFCAKEVCRDMSRPRKSSWGKLRHLARYLVEFPRLVWRYDGNEEASGVSHTARFIDVFSDSDWAGCLRTRRSTSGGVVVWEGAVLKSWSSTQATIALSSGEAEYYAAVRASAEGLGIQSLMWDLGLEAKVRMWLDASAAKSVALSPSCW